MRRYVFRFAMLTLAVLGPGAVRGDDQEIAAKIIEKLQAEKQAGTLKGFSIDMQVDEGTVWLSGRVATSAQQAKALDIARRIPGVVQVVNDLEIASAAPKAVAASSQPSTVSVPAVATQPAAKQPAVTIKATSIPATPIGSAASTEAASTASTSKPKAAQQPESAEKPFVVKPAVAAQEAGKSLPGAIGSGVKEASPSLVQSAQPVANVPQTLAAMGLPYGTPAQPMPQAGAPGGGQPFAMIPVFAGSQSQVPLAFAPARTVNYTGGPEGMAVPGEGVQGAPVPMYMPGSGVGIAPARYDHPQMPGYAWPSYAAHPNYAAVTYPKQYSPTAWPYIGPFYPYPQVPLGWRKVTLEWDDGWWVLDFKDRRTMYNHK